MSQLKNIPKIQGTSIAKFVLFSIVYFIAIHQSLHLLGPITGSFAVAPILYFNWRFGRRRGMLLGIYSLLITLLVFTTHKVSTDWLAYFIGGSAAILVGYLMGWLKETLDGYKQQSKELCEEKDRLEVQNGQLKELKLKLTASEKKFRTLFELAPDPYFILDGEGIIVDGNKNAELIFGSPRKQFFGKNIKTMALVEEQKSQIGEHLSKSLRNLSTGSHEYEFLKWDGSNIPVELHLQAVTLENKRVILGTIRDISIRKAAEKMLRRMNADLEDLVTERTDALEESRAKLEHEALHDALTDLPNRALLADRLALSLEQIKRFQDHQFAVLFIDIDHFKVVNDSLGHQIGDRLLVSVAERLKKCTREVDTVARIGGDEFVVLIEHAKSVNDVIDVVNRIMDITSKPYQIIDHELYVSLSIGVTLSSDAYSNQDELLRDADIALYRAKQNGRSRYELFDHTMHIEAQKRMQMETDMHKGIENNEFCVYYQPIMDILQNKLIGFEALVRWDHPSFGLISPADFIPLAEETGMIIQLGKHVILESCKQCREWQGTYRNKDLSISINLSGKQIIQPNFLDELDIILTATELDPKTLIFEITEGILIENTSAVKNTLEGLRNRGIRVHLDDFGTGYSSLNYLNQFPFDVIKIDRTFISSISGSLKKNEIVEAIINLAGGMEKKVIAEGIETDEQLCYLESISCDMGQGFYFSRPVAAEKMDSYLSLAIL
jgi:diguanylate cyclase (GGDEF)-like protein/PAS domain S-box-containing protein